MRTYLILLFSVLLFLGGFWSLTSEVFLTWPNILNVITASSTVGILAIGATIVIGSGGIDLSVGSLLALSATVTSLSIFPIHYHVALIVLSCLMTGILIGAVNGYLIGRVKLPAFIVTLGMLSFARGIALIISDGRPFYGLPSEIVFLGQGVIYGIPVPVILFVVATLFSQILISNTRFGLHLLAIGDNETAARDAGIQVVLTKVLIYSFSGFLAGLAGLITMGRTNAADPSSGTMYELTAITAAVIGGTTLAGGRASVIGAVLGSLIMGVLQNGLALVDVPAYYQQVAIGAALIAAVAIGQWRGEFATSN